MPHDDYAIYQEKYSHEAKKSDIRLLSLIAQFSNTALPLVDMGCSTGNLLRLMRTKGGYSGKLLGVDLDRVAIEVAKKTSNGISYYCRNMVGFADELMNPRDEGYNVVFNASLSYFSNDELEDAWPAFNKLRSGNGKIFIFDRINEFKQDLRIEEKSELYPGGVTFYYRSIHFLRKMLRNHGGQIKHDEPSLIPIDLPRPQPESIRSWTQRTNTGERWIMRGNLMQPWHFVVVA